jgi:hypothetical protein
MRHRVVIKYALISETLVANVGSIVLYAYFCIFMHTRLQSRTVVFKNVFAAVPALSVNPWINRMHSNLLPAIEFKHSNIERVRANSGRLYLELPMGPSIAKSCAYTFFGLCTFAG